KIKTPEVKMFAFTAQALPEEQEEILAQGFDGLLLKPFKEKDLLKLLNIHVEEIPPQTSGAKTTTHLLGHDDEEQASRILQLYVNDTLADLSTLQARYEDRDLSGVELLLHRIAGRTAQVGAGKIAIRLRKLEIDARSGELPDAKEYENVVAELTAF